MKRIIVFLSLLLVSANSWSGWLGETFIDPTDGQLDLSNWLLNKKGFLPVPIIITEPAVGYGGGLGLAYFHDDLGGKDKIPPSITFIAAAGTENGTWFAGGGHMGIWQQDNIRYKGGIGTGLVKMDYYGLSGDQGSKLERGLEFETEANILLQELLFRINKSNFFAGANYTLVDTSNTFDLTVNDQPVASLSGITFDSRSAALGLVLEYDSLNNIMTPTNGIKALLESQFYRESVGSDDNFDSYHMFIKYYNNFSKNWVLGLRADAKAIEGDAPFYVYPFVQMRGIKMLRYQGKQTTLGETELDWAFSPRWTLVGFAGAGKAHASSEQNDSDLIVSWGGGFRYLTAAKLGLKMGLDVGVGLEDTIIYITVGNAWTR